MVRLSHAPGVEKSDPRYSVRASSYFARTHSIVSIASSMEKFAITCTQKIFSPIGADMSPQVVYYVIWDWASKVTVIAFNGSNPLLVTHLGDKAFGENEGKILWTYLVAVMYIITAVCFLTFTAILEYENMKCTILFYCGLISATCSILFILCFVPDAVYIACTLALVAKITFNFSNLAFDSLLNCVATGKDPHQISTRSFITGYVGMIVFAAVLFTVLAIIYFSAEISESYIMYGIVPNVCIGIWYLCFGWMVMEKFPWEIGYGAEFPSKTGALSDVSASPPLVMPKISAGSFASSSSHNPMASSMTTNKSIRITSASFQSSPSEMSIQQLNSDFLKQKVSNPQNKSETGAVVVAATASTPDPEKTGKCSRFVSWICHVCGLIVYGFKQGSKMQFDNIKALHQFPDLLMFILAFVFIEGAETTGVSVGVIILVDLFAVSKEIIVACGACGLISSILGLFLFRYANAKSWLSPKTILMINVVVFILIVLSLLDTNSKDITYLVLMFSIIGGSQIGSVGAFAKSIVAQLCPDNRQSRVFSLYQFCQVSTSWIGPLLIASINTASHGNNSEFVYLTVLVVAGQLVIGLPLLWCVNIERGVDLRKIRDCSDML